MTAGATRTYFCPRCGVRRNSGGDCLVDGSPLAEIVEGSLLGQQIGNYIVVRLLGEGGMGAVYQAVQPSIGAQVAIKVLHATPESQQNAVQRFLLEARAVNRVQHPSLIKILDTGALADRRPYLVMELLDGIPLSDVVGKVPWFVACHIAADALDALDVVHQQDIVHRDLKPENIFLARGGRVVVLDFGIAKLITPDAAVKVTTSGIIGTPEYMSPEQIRSRAIDRRTDVYAMGVVLYEALTGRRPFAAAATFDMLVQHVERMPPSPREWKPELPTPVADIVLQALAKEPEHRFSTAAAMAAALRAQIAGHGALSSLAAIVDTHAPIKAPTVASSSFEEGAFEDDGHSTFIDQPNEILGRMEPPAHAAAYNPAVMETLNDRPVRSRVVPADINTTAPIRPIAKRAMTPVAGVPADGNALMPAPVDANATAALRPTAMPPIAGAPVEAKSPFAKPTPPVGGAISSSNAFSPPHDASSNMFAPPVAAPSSPFAHPAHSVAQPPGRSDEPGKALGPPPPIAAPSSPFARPAPPAPAVMLRPENVAPGAEPRVENAVSSGAMTILKEPAASGAEKILQQPAASGAMTLPVGTTKDQVAFDGAQTLSAAKTHKVNRPFDTAERAAVSGGSGKKVVVGFVAAAVLVGAFFVVNRLVSSHDAAKTVAASSNAAGPADGSSSGNSAMSNSAANNRGGTADTEGTTPGTQTTPTASTTPTTSNTPTTGTVTTTPTGTATTTPTGANKPTVPTFAERTGIVVVETIPPGAKVTVDNGGPALSPANLAVAPGRHAFRIVLDGYETIEETQDIPANTRTLLRLPMTKSTKRVKTKSAPGDTQILKPGDDDLPFMKQNELERIPPAPPKKKKQAWDTGLEAL